MGAGSLRRRLPDRARRPAAPRDLRRAGGVSAPRDPGACRGLILALRPRARSVPRLQGAQDMVHLENLRAGKARSDDHAHLHARQISGEEDFSRAGLELLAPVQLNIVCFRYRAADTNRVNGDIVIAIQESGVAAPSTTLLNGELAIRAAIVNHRTDTCDIDALISAVLEFGAQQSSSDDSLVLEVGPSPPLAM